jgi:cellulose synthase/poly-beta-1,6-N-acetylglucosamine synthase-like glycosyltransferase
VHIVNDGGNADDVDAAVAELAPDWRARVAVTHHSESHGRSAAANEGVRRLDTEFVVLHDDDDLWAPQFLSRAVAWLDAHPDDIGAVARTEIVYEAEGGAAGAFQEIGRAPFWEGMNEIRYSDLLQINRFVPIAYLYRRSLHDEVGPYREDIHAAEDWEFNLRAAAGHHIGFLGGEPAAFWMQRAGVTGELGNSMFALEDEHRRYDAQVRDDALRAYVSEFGPGLPLYLTRFIEVEVARIVREQVSAELDRRPSDLDRVRARLRRLFRRG